LDPQIGAAAIGIRFIDQTVAVVVQSIAALTPDAFGSARSGRRAAMHAGSVRCAIIEAVAFTFAKAGYAGTAEKREVFVDLTVAVIVLFVAVFWGLTVRVVDVGLAIAIIVESVRAKSGVRRSFRARRKRQRAALEAIASTGASPDPRLGACPKSRLTWRSAQRPELVDLPIPVIIRTITELWPHTVGIRVINHSIAIVVIQV